MADSTRPRYGQIDRHYGLRLATTPPDDDGPVWMINLMHYRDEADYGDTGGGGGEGGGRLSGREADDRYAPTEVLADIGAEVVLYGDVEAQFLTDEPRWHRVGVVKYPTRRSFIDMQARSDFQERHVHKDAGMAATIVMGGQPMLSPPLPADAPDWTEVPHPPTADDGPVMVVHVLGFHEPRGELTPDDMEAYTSHAARVAVANGVRIGGWFGVEGTIVGDGRRWDQVRFNAFPSMAAFMAVALDPDRLAAQRAHREPALAHTYTLVVRPTIDRLTPRATP